MRLLALTLLCVGLSLSPQGRAQQPAATQHHETTQKAPPLQGLAHVALRVADLDRSLKFYESLGIHQAFSFRDGERIGQVFLKVNDTQFVELYPVRTGDTPGFMHLCFLTNDANALYEWYVKNGLTPTPVKKARAGNLLFTLEGPEKQNIEYTQMLPGSLHSEDKGKHLDPQAIAKSILTVSLAMADPAAAKSFYLQRLTFAPAPQSSESVVLPGTSSQRVAFDSPQRQPHARVFFKMQNLPAAKRKLHDLGIDFTQAGKAISVLDPDGNQLLFTTAKYID